VIKECPNHGGAFDCNPFCSICEGEQEYNDTGYDEGYKDALLKIKENLRSMLDNPALNDLPSDLVVKVIIAGISSELEEDEDGR
jgi:hypothetical protein